jgi:hypothetical protein
VHGDIILGLEDPEALSNSNESMLEVRLKCDFNSSKITAKFSATGS